MILLQEAVLVRFGKFHNVTLPFSKGLQIIYGGNEAGKSTIQLFIKVMLYGIVGSKKDNKGLKLRDRIIPWEEKNAEGILRLDVDGRCLEIRRKFGKTASGDKTEILDGNTGEVIPEFDVRKLGEQLLGVPEAVFEKTFWLQQGGAVFAGADEEINKRLMNLLETGAEEISAEETLIELEKESKAIKAKDKRSNPGELDRLWTLREEKLQERYQLLSQRGQREAEEKLLKVETQKLDSLKQEELRWQAIAEQKKNLVVLESRRKKWEEAEKLSSLAKQAESRDEFRRFSGLDENIVQKAENLEKRREPLDQTAAIEYDIGKEEQVLHQKKKEEQRFGVLLLIGVGLVVAAGIFAAMRLTIWGVWASTLGIAGILLFALGFLRMQASKTAAWQSAEKKKALLDTQRESQRERESTEAELQKILLPYGCKNAAELREGFLLCKQAQIEAEGYMRTYESMLEGEDASALSQEVAEMEDVLEQNADILAMDVDAELLRLRQAQIDSVAKIKESESKLSYVFHGGRNPADIETELLQINQKITQLEKRQKALELAKEVFAKVAEKRKSDFTPQVNEKVNDFLGILTDGKYQDARVSQEYQLRLLPDKTHLYQAEFFSAGTYEQIYFALRLSLLTFLGEGTEPLFLDDFLTSYDDKRAELAMGLLEQLAKKRQILFFSCHGREAENAKKRNLTIRYLEEERSNVC